PGFAATSGSRLFMSIRKGASVSQLFAESSRPRAARTTRALSIRVIGKYPVLVKGQTARSCRSACKDPRMQRIEPHPVDQFGRPFDVPDGEVTTLTGIEAASLTDQAERAGGFSGHGGEALL